MSLIGSDIQTALYPTVMLPDPGYSIFMRRACSEPPTVTMQYLEMGMADALITKLSNIRQIIVRPTSSILKYADSTEDAVAAGRALGVDSVLDGSIQRAGDQIRITVRLVSVSDGAPLWADTFDESFTNIFSVQDSISQRMADVLAPKPGDKDHAFEWLEKAYEERDSLLIFINTVPTFDSLHSDPRFGNLIRSIGLAR